MAFAEDRSFAEVTATSPGRVELAFHQDADRWPWQALAAQHPVLLDMYFYFGPVSAILALGLATPDAQTAMTGLEWQCYPVEEPSPATRGVCTFPNLEARDPSFELELRTASGERLATAKGRGVEFANRDFAAWRAGTKAQILAAGAQPPVERASREELGLGRGWIPFVSRVHEADGARSVRAIVTSREGFPPVHAFHAGSGDHVNVGHLHDCALQAARLVHGAPFACTGGQGRFRRYVELDVPFELKVLSREGPWIRLACSQQGHPCAELGLRIAPVR